MSTLAACTGRLPEGDTDTAGSSSSSDGSSGGSTTGTGSGSEPTSGGSEPTSGATSTGEPTTGDPVECALGPEYSPGWSTLAVLPQPQHTITIVESIVTLSDGRHAFSGLVRPDDASFAPGVFWIAADGQPLKWVAGAPSSVIAASLLGLRVAGDDSVVLVGDQLDDGPRRPYVARFAAGGPELSRVDVQTQKLNSPLDFEVHGDEVVMIGYDRPDTNLWLARFDPSTGAVSLEIELPSFGTPLPREVAIGPGGEIVVVANVQEETDAFRLWRVDAAGAVVWQTDVHGEVSRAGWVRDLAVTPDGQVVAVTTRDAPVQRVGLAAFALADGAPTWELEVAVEDETGSTVARHVLVDDDSLVLPVVYAPDPQTQTVAGPMTAALQRVSFAGAPLSTQPLTPGEVEGSPGLAITRGLCGDPVVLQNNISGPWLGSIAP